VTAPNLSIKHLLNLGAGVAGKEGANIQRGHVGSLLVKAKQENYWREIRGRRFSRLQAISMQSTGPAQIA
jgi:hypothetical protein